MTSPTGCDAYSDVFSRHFPGELSSLFEKSVDRFSELVDYFLKSVDRFLACRRKKRTRSNVPPTNKSAGAGRK